jgi:AICAR transformylase/IMP cyclohydrolase PurH
MTNLKEALKIGQKKNKEIVEGIVKTIEPMISYYKTFGEYEDELEIRVQYVIDQIFDEIYISISLIENDIEVDRFHEDIVIGGPGKTKIIAEDIADALRVKKINANYSKAIFN